MFQLDKINLRQAPEKSLKYYSGTVRYQPANTFNLSASGPNLTTLTLVDLPGAHFANDDPRMNQATQSLVLDYIEKNTKSIIVIVSEVGDPTGDSAINLVMRKAKDFRQRTICVLTKPDRLRETDDMGVKVALNKSSFTLEDGRFIVLRGTIGVVAFIFLAHRSPGANNLQRATFIYSCNNVFTNQFNFRNILAQI